MRAFHLVPVLALGYVCLSETPPMPAALTQHRATRTAAEAAPVRAPLQASRQSEGTPLRHRAVQASAIEPESTQTCELRADPQPGRAGDQWATQPIPAFLKGEPYRLSYVGGDYLPAASERLDPQLHEAWLRGASTGAEKTWGFVMLQGRITAAKMQRVEALGVQLLEFHTFQCFSAVLPYAAIGRLLASADVRWVGQARPQQKLDPELAARIDEADPAASCHLFVTVYESDLTPAARRLEFPATERTRGLQTVVGTTTLVIPEGPFQHRLEACGARILSYDDRLRVFQVRTSLTSVERIAAEDFVHFVELVQPVRLDHDRSTRQIGVDLIRHKTATDGSSAIVGMLDSGAHVGDGRHQDLNKFAVGWNYHSGGSVFNETVGHGTHVLGTIGGTGTANSRYKGCAPAIGGSGTKRIFVAKIAGASTPGDWPDNTLRAMNRLAQSYTDGANNTTPRPHVINNSWGYGDASSQGYAGTDSISRAVDSHVYSDRQCYVFSAGNEGGDNFTTEYWKSIRRPGVAKNALTVASCVDYRGSKDSVTFDPGRPWYESGKGATRDGRFKPNILAPGVSIRSCKTQTTASYTNMSGTSMAAPHVTGVIAGLMDHYSEYKYRPHLAKARVAANTNPYGGKRNWTSSSASYYYRQGLGQLDAYKANHTRTGFTSGQSEGTFTVISAGASFDVDVPADAEQTFFVLNFDERQASAGASRACLADLDLYLDVAPFSAGYNTGEYSSTRAWDTWDWYGNISSIAAVRGKTVRVKIYPRVRPAVGTLVHWAVAYHIPRADVTPSSTVGLYANPPAAQPNALFTLRATVQVPEFIQTNSYLSLSSHAGYDVLMLRFQTPSGLSRSYTSISLFGTADSVHNWTLGHQGSWYDSDWRRITWTMKRSTEGLKDICVRLRADNRSTPYTICKSYCIDGKKPNDVTGLTSTSHTPNVWSGNGKLDMVWNIASDVGCAGVGGLGYKVPAISCIDPTEVSLPATATSKSVLLGSSPAGRVFCLRVRDNALNWSNTVSAGPYLIDIKPSTVIDVTLHDGAQHISTLDSQVKAEAKDDDSGVADMRYSADDRTWSAWMRYTTANRKINLSAYGGNRQEGVKRIFVQVRDRAGNISASNSDSITYLKLATISSVSPSALGNVTDARFRVTGSDFLEVTKLTIAGAAITSTSPDDWYRGYFRVVSDTLLELSPPQGLAPGTYPLQLVNPVGPGNTVKFMLIHPRTRTLHCPEQLASGKTLHVLAHHGNLPPTTFSLFTLSASSSPSVLPGLLSLGHGGAFGPTFVLVPIAFWHDSKTHVARFVAATPKGLRGTIFSQAVMIDAANPTVVPFPVSNVDSVRLY